MTTARYFTPSGRSIQAEGIVPDIEIEAVKISSTEKGLTYCVSKIYLATSKMAMV